MNLNKRVAICCGGAFLCICMMILTQLGCNSRDMKTFYKTKNGELTCDGSVFYRQMTANEFSTWFPNNGKGSIVGTYLCGKITYDALTIENDPDHVFLKFRGGSDIRPSPYIRTDVELPNNPSILPVNVQPFNADEAIGSISSEAIIILFESISDESNIITEPNDVEGYAFACSYEGFPQISRVVYVQPFDNTCYSVREVEFGVGPPKPSHLIADKDSVDIISEIFEVLESQNVAKGFSLGGKNSLVATW